VSHFYGRTEEFALLEQWILNDRCRLVVLLGMGVKLSGCQLAEQVKEKFEYVIWRSLYNAPPLEDILTSLIQFLSNSQAPETDISRKRR